MCLCSFSVLGLEIKLVKKRLESYNFLNPKLLLNTNKTWVSTPLNLSYTNRILKLLLSHVDEENTALAVILV